MHFLLKIYIPTKGYAHLYTQLESVSGFLTFYPCTYLDVNAFHCGKGPPFPMALHMVFLPAISPGQLIYVFGYIPVLIATKSSI